MSDTHNYYLVYPDLCKSETELSGGYVEMHSTHIAQETKRNVETAIHLARLGFKVRLLPITTEPNIKNSDAYLIEEDIVIEFKHNMTPTASAIENELRDAKRQANYVLIHIKSGLTKENLIKGLRRQIHRAMNVREVWLIYNQVLTRLTPDEIRGRNAEDKIQ